jgi:parvulin-like peptidyl-prolyl isomerase
MLRESRWLIVLAGGILLSACGGGKGSDEDAVSKAVEKTRAKDFTKVIAKVGDMTIDQGYFDRRFAELSKERRQKFTGEGWRDRFLDQLIDETVAYHKALDEKYDQDPDVQLKLEMARRAILMKAYTDQIRADAVPTEEEIQNYYERNKEKYKPLDRLLVSHIACKDKSKIDEAYRKLKSGEKWEKVAHEYDEDPNSQPHEGLIGWINPKGFVIGVGFQQKFNDVAFSLGFREYSKPVEINGEWHIIRAGQKQEAKVPTLEQARDRVIADLRPYVARRHYAKVLKQLKKQYGVERFGDYKKTTAQTAEQLYQRAADVHDPQTRVAYYEQLADNFPDSDLADEALFMAGFICSEQLYQKHNAIKDFQRLLNDYPQSKYVDDATWMIQHSGTTGLGKEEEPSAQKIQQKIDTLKKK